MKATVETPVRAVQERPVLRRRASAAVKVEVGTGAIAPKVAIVRRRASAPVNVEVGTGAIAPKVAIARRKPPTR